MITSQLYINDEIADLSDDKPIAITFQVNDLADLSDRQSTYSQTIKLPKTANNKTLLGYADSDSFTQAVPYIITKAKLVQNGVEVIPYGIIIIQQVSDFFECQMLYGIYGLAQLLTITTIDSQTGEPTNRDLKLSDLDWSDIPNFFMTLQTIIDAQNGIGQPWPIIDYGDTLDGSSNIQAAYLKPAVYAYQIVQRIARYIGYTFSGNILSDDFFNAEIIPFSDGITINDLAGGNSSTSGLPISIAANLPDFSVKDYLKDLMQRYFLTPVVDNYKKTIEFHSFDELYANMYKAYDWTDKFLDDARTDTFQMSGYSQTNYLNWAADEPFLQMGNGEIVINNANITSISTTLVTSIFAASDVKLNGIGSLPVASIIKYLYSPLNGGTVGNKYSETKTRVLTLKKLDGIFSFSLGDQTMYTNNGASYGYFAGNTDRGMGWNDMLSNYGQGLTKILTKFRSPTRYVYLTPVDLYNFDFFTPVYDAREAKYYYVNKIINYINGQKVKVQLIRL